MERSIIPASEGRAHRVPKGARFRITTPKGAQAADFFAYNAETISEWLSPMHTWVLNRSVKPREGQSLISRFRRPMLTFTKDGAGGVHDMMLAACDQFRYEQYGHEGHHPSCAENLHIAMRREGYEIDVVPQPINFFYQYLHRCRVGTEFTAQHGASRVLCGTGGTHGPDLCRFVVPV